MKFTWTNVGDGTYQTEEQRDDTPDVLILPAEGGGVNAKLRTSAKWSFFNTATEAMRYYDHMHDRLKR